MSVLMNKLDCIETRYAMTHNGYDYEFICSKKNHVWIKRKPAGSIWIPPVTGIWDGKKFSNVISDRGQFKSVRTLIDACEIVEQHG